jgi:hypothetical protein
MNLKLHINISLGYFLVVIFLGVIMRMYQVIEMDFNYKNILHTHSHIALLGWVYTALTTLIFQLFLAEKNIERSHRRLFWSTQISIIGMMVTFSFTGYALFSIIFSTYFLINSYVFLRLFLKHTSKEQKKTNPYKLIRASLWLMALSSLGPWALGGIMNTLGSTSSWYRNAIYFYLHFQYNGWFLLALIGLLFSVFERHSINVTQKNFQIFYCLFLSGIFLTFFLSVLWMNPPLFYNYLGGFGSVLQIVAFGLLLKILWKNKKNILINFSNYNFTIVKIIGVLYAAKLVLQLIGSVPYYAGKFSSNIDFIIAYLHWIFLGIVTMSLFVLLKNYKLLKINKVQMFVYFFAFILTESLLFYKGYVVYYSKILINDYYTYLFLASILFLVAITWLVLLQFKKK